MKYTLMIDFREAGTYEGVPGKDAVGEYIIFPMTYSEILTVGAWLKDPAGHLIWVTQSDYVTLDGTRYLKLYH